MDRIFISDDRFVDEHHRHVILHGINMVCKEKKLHYIGEWAEDDFRRLKEWGFNFIRLGVIWDGVEPEPGVYDDDYLGKLREQIRMARDHGLYVLLDMHQDLYSAAYGDGAPSWATLSDGAAYVPTEPWSDAYLFDRAVQTAFDQFWNNAPGPDGVGIQDRYAMAWRHIAWSLGHEPNVIGYDLMNEPFIGSNVNAIVERMLHAYGEIWAEANGATAADMSDLAEIWTDPLRKLEALKLLEQPQALESMMQAMAPAQHSFEKKDLMCMFNRVASLIREVDPNGLLFLETNYFSNMGVPSGIEPVVEQGGRRDPHQAYAPHGYDFVTDTPYAHMASEGRVDYIFNSHESTRKRLNMPMLIGEWGAYYGSLDAEKPSLFMKRKFEKLLCSDAYWSYFGAETGSYSSFRGVCRGYPLATAGILRFYRDDHETGTFTMEWEEEAGASRPTTIYLPDMSNLAPEAIKLEPRGLGYSFEQIGSVSAGYVHIPPAGGGGRRIAIHY
ncbi:cellulase family glycosylhydrolase [Paenibacillus aurantiacus]|uniref:Cellulase family glycosylhydrolase n=1 Tax=Paenibacillus aurantiacus TaxID=1936118 RepID=A0ABV5KRW4_9BACL